jgi:hypothetical protein
LFDLKYHITSIVAIFLALGLGVLIGSSIVGDNLLVDQQKKMIDRLEEQFYIFQDKEKKLEAENEAKNIIIANYERYSQATLPLLVQDRLKGYKASIIVTGDSDTPESMLKALAAAGAEIVSRATILNMNLDSSEIRNRLTDFYNLDNNTSQDTLRHYVAVSVAALISGLDDPGLESFLEQNNLVKFSINSSTPVDGVIILGGANNSNNDFSRSFDQGLIKYFNSLGIKVYGVEQSKVVYSYISTYQEHNISTVDNIEVSPGQISLVLAMEGEAGHYGIKPTANKFMPVLYLNNTERR